MQAHNKIWGLICLLAYLIGGSAHSTQAQDCEFYQSMIQAGDAAFQENNYTQALRKFTSAMIHCPENSNVAYQRMQAVFDRMESLRKRSDSVRMIIQEAQARMELAMFDNAVRRQVPDWKGLNNYYYEDPKGLLGQIDSLDFSHSGLLKIPEMVFYCTNLRHVNLLGNPDLNIDSLHDFLDSMQVNANQLNSVYLSVYSLDSLDKDYRPFVRGLELIHPNLAGEADKSQDYRLNKLSDYTNVESLSIPENGIRFLPENLGSLKQLNYLNLSFNKLMALPPSIGELSNLTYLNISHNALQSLPAEFYQLSRLIDLKAQHNTLFDLDKRLKNFQELEILDLSYNVLSTLPNLNYLQKLRKLNLAGNPIAFLASLDSLEQLQELVLKDNPYIDVKEIELLKSYLKKTNVVYLQNSLGSDTQLEMGDSLVSANWEFYMTVQRDGNVVIYPDRPLAKGERVPWQTNTYYAGEGCILRLQDGNLSVFDAQGRAIWSSRTGPNYNPAFSFEDTYPVKAVLENDGNLHLKSIRDNVVWQSQKGNLYGKGNVFPPQTWSLKAGEKQTNNYGFALELEQNGNFRLYKLEQPKTTLWETGTSMKGPGSHLDMQADGHLVLYDSQKKVPWKSGTHPYHDRRFSYLFTKPVSAQIGPDGVLRLRNAAGFVLWETKTGSNTGEFTKFPNSYREIKPDEELSSPDGVYSFKVNNKGGYIYKTLTKSDVWSTGTQAQNAELIFQEDGNLVLYDVTNDERKPIWASDTHPAFDSRFRSQEYKPVFLKLGNDGQLALYSITGRKVWQTVFQNLQGEGALCPLGKAKR